MPFWTNKLISLSIFSIYHSIFYARFRQDITKFNEIRGNPTSYDNLKWQNFTWIWLFPLKMSKKYEFYRITSYIIVWHRTWILMYDKIHTNYDVHYNYNVRCRTMPYDEIRYIIIIMYDKIHTHYNVHYNYNVRCCTMPYDVVRWYTVHYNYNVR